MVFRSGGKEDSKHSGATGKFLGKGGRPPGTSNQTNSISLQQGNFTDESDGATVRASLSIPCPSITPNETNFSSLINQKSDLIRVLNTLRVVTISNTFGKWILEIEVITKVRLEKSS